MEDTKHMSKAQLEQRLKEKGDAISGRFESIESRIPKKIPSLLSAATKGSKSNMFLAVGAGLLVGMVLFRRKSSKAVPYDDGLENLSTQLAHRIAKGLSQGADSKEAVRKALEEQPPLMALSPETESILTSALKQVFQVGVSMAGSQLSDYLRNRKKTDQSS